ncbi:beta-ketoacyl-ACP synthase III [Bacillus carboniphilus]|uniref:Beta-ketoacyl-ACP synthase III n=1 Tax=Bacillus carboniphilus TaxID=86663 RepID=A0ABP3FZ84_9BACI
MRNVRIISSGIYLPKKKVYSTDIDHYFNETPGTMEALSGVRTRYYVEDETASEMGTQASIQALSKANLSIKDIDCIVCASGTMEQPIPSTASFIHQKLAGDEYPIPAFDVNSTCLSFVTAFDLLGNALHLGQYKKVLLVSTEISSVGLNKNDRKTHSLFGDGAAAFILEASSSSKLLGSLMRTYSSGVHYTEIPGGGTKLHPNLTNSELPFLFHMDGKKVFKTASKYIQTFVEDLCESSHVRLKDIDYIVPHQASGSAIDLMEKRLQLKPGQMIKIVRDYGNMIAASIPFTLHLLLEEHDIKRGTTIMLLGTSAGLSIGGLVIEY